MEADGIDMDSVRIEYLDEVGSSTLIPQLHRGRSGTPLTIRLFLDVDWQIRR
jgi:hypothetical protein